MSEKLMAVTKPYTSGESETTMLWIIPSDVRKALNIRKGEKFAVKIDDQGRVIYERIS